MDRIEPRMDRTEICITIDTEFSIGGAFANPCAARPIGEEHVYCPAGGEAHGLPFLLRTFREFGTRATFFVEALNACHFGDRPMGRIVDEIVAAGQDAQLHVHPCWLHFRHPDWAEKLAGDPPDDSCAGRTPAELDEIIGEALDVFGRWNAPRPIALRTGNLHADLGTYSAMARQGLRIASNLGVALFRPADPSLHVYGGGRWIQDVLELPVLSYVQLALARLRRYRLLTITAASWPETRALLYRARAAGLSPIVILTHPFEFVKTGRNGRGRTGANRINQRRLERLCRFLAENDDGFVATSFVEAAPRWLTTPPAERAPLQAPIATVLGRIVGNKANDLIPAL